MGRVSEETIKKITAEFEKGLRKSLFSDKDYPKESTIITVYNNCTQTLSIKFSEDRKEA